MFKHAAATTPGTAILDCAGMSRADAFAVRAGVPSITLMERAGAELAGAVTRRWGRRPVAVLCGPGNNGGDGFVAARLLAAAGWPVSVFQLGECDGLTGDAALAARGWRAEVEPLESFVAGKFGLVIDALFGAGLSRPLEGAARTAVLAANAASAVRVAVDVPSGVAGDRANVEGAAFNADLTVTFHRLKPAHLFEPARSHCGDIVCAGIGIPEGWEADASPLGHLARLEDLIFPSLPHLSGVHKHQRGRLCVLAGGPGATSAARLSAEAGLNIGAGLVTLLCPPSSLIEATQAPAPVMTRALREENFAQALGNHRASAAVLGPGAGAGNRLKVRVLEALGTGIPLVLDADALSVFAEAPEALLHALHEQVVLTPHAGEFGRLFPGLLGDSATPLHAARSASALSGAIVLLKGPATVIAAPSGACAVNAHASARLATAGSGDVLSGMIGGLLAQGIAPFDAAVSAAWLHGQAGFLLPAGGTADDLLDRLPVVLSAALEEKARRRVLDRLAR
jgi:NAD(P)H-hydrate epimerase